MNFFTTTTLIIKRLSFLFLLTFSFSLTSSAQGTTLTPGDIMVLQIDEGTGASVGEGDKFIFVSFVDLVAGTTIYFTDCGVFLNGSFTDLSTDPAYTSCPEGATKFVAASAIEAGSIFQYGGAVDPQFSSHTDALITGSAIDFTYSGDQVIVFQDTDGAGGSDPSANPSFVFILNANDGNFTSNPSPSLGDDSGTSVPVGLNKFNAPVGSATAMAVGTGDGEFDNTVFDGTGLIPFSGATLAEKIQNAKIAILASPGVETESNGLNWHGVNNLNDNPFPYFNYEASLLNALNILPVELTSFDGRPKVKTIDLQWITASEINNDYFTVEKSTNGIDFNELADINGRGTTTLQSFYNWADQFPNDGLNYYRLLQVDFNGEKSYSDIIAIEFKADREEIQLYPNPTVREVNINLPENWEGETTVVIYDFYGNMINSFNVSSGSLTFPVDNIPTGFYRLSATNKSKMLNTSFVKN